MQDANTVEELGRQYAAEGYEVWPNPSPDILPGFLSGDPVDLLARKGDRIVVVQVPRGGQPDFRRGILEVRAPDLGYAKLLLWQVERLDAEGVIRPIVVVTAWLAVETVVRESAHRRGRSDAERVDIRTLFETLRQEGAVTNFEFAELERCMVLRNAIVQGFQPEPVPGETIPFLTGLAKRLLGAAGVRTVPRTSTGVLHIRYSDAVESESLRKRLELANEILGRIVVARSAEVTAEWDVAEATGTHPVIVLRLSDAGSAATATFAEDELDNKQHLRGRIERLWGDLLQFRSHRMLEELYATNGSGN